LYHTCSSHNVYVHPLKLLNQASDFRNLSLERGSKSKYLNGTIYALRLNDMIPTIHDLRGVILRGKR